MGGREQSGDPLHFKHAIAHWRPLAFVTVLSACAEFIGKPVGGSDGDSITVLHDRAQLKIRPAAIDSPVKVLAFGKLLKRELRDNFAFPPKL